MKHLFIATLFLSTSAFAYHSGTNANYPVKEDAVQQEKREPAAVTKEEKPEPAKVAPAK